MTKIRVVLALYLLFIPGVMMARNIETGFLNRALEIDGKNYLYQVYVPREYDAAKEWPLILSLHGSGESGDDGMKPTQVGIAGSIRFHPERWPAIAVFPQVRYRESWAGPSGRIGMEALEATLAEFNIDNSRIYLTGLSLGGSGVWQLACENPDRFAALVPICGFVDDYNHCSELISESDDGYCIDLARHLAHIPIWIFHGGADPTVPVEESRRIFKALEEVGASVKYNEFPDVGHNSWDPAYEMEELATWMFGQQRE